MPNDVISIGNHAFYHCDQLKSINLPNSIVTINDSAFSYNCSLILTSLPENLTSIGDYAFNYCFAFTDLVIASQVLTSIGKDAFALSFSYNPTRGLSSIEITSPVLTLIDNYAFYGDELLTQVVLRATTPPTLGTNVFTNTPIAKKTGFIYVPDDSLEAYKSATNWSAYADQIKPISEMEAGA